MRAVMDGNTRDVGSRRRSAGHAAGQPALAHEVMKRLPHVMLTGDGARRFCH